MHFLRINPISYFIILLITCYNGKALAEKARDLPDAKTIRSFSKIMENTLMYSTGFENPNSPEIKFLTDGICYEKGGGLTGNTALKLQGHRVKGRILLPKGKFLEGVQYTVKVFVRGNVRAKDGKKHGSFRFMEVKYSDDASGRSANWQLGVFPFTTYPQDADDINQFKEFSFNFYGRKGMTPSIDVRISDGQNEPFDGTIWFDDLRVYQTGVDSNINTVLPFMRAFRNGNGKFQLQAMTPETAQPCMLISLKKEGKKLRELVIAPDANGFYNGDFGSGLPEGNFSMNVVLADISEKTILSSKTFPVTVRPIGEIPPKGWVTFDKKGRTLVDGIPFFVIGLGCVQPISNMDKNHLQRHAEAGFNVLDTCVFNLVNEKHSNHAELLRKKLDEIAKLGMKVRLHLVRFYHSPNRCGSYGPGPAGVEKLLSQIKDHPAILGYYLLDELTEKEWPPITALRETINRVDPWHPTYSCTNILSSIPKIAVTCDAIQYDCYPVGKGIDPAHPSQIKTAGDMTRNAGIPFCAISQGFNWGILRDKEEEYRKYIDPDANQMLAVALRFVLNGARDMRFYTCPLRNTFRSNAKKFNDPDHPEKMFLKLAHMTAAMKKIEPYLLSDTDMREIKIKKGRDVDIQAGLFQSDNGKHMLIIMGTNAEGEIEIPGVDNLKSEYGHTVNLGGGKYRFTAAGLGCDILQQP